MGEPIPQQPLEAQPTAAMQGLLNCQGKQIREQPEAWPVALERLYRQGHLEQPLQQITLRAASWKDRAQSSAGHAVVTFPAHALHDTPAQTTERIFTAILTDPDQNPHLKKEPSPHFWRRVTASLGGAAISTGVAFVGGEMEQEVVVTVGSLGVVIAGIYVVRRMIISTLQNQNMRRKAVQTASELAQSLPDAWHPISFTHSR